VTGAQERDLSTAIAGPAPCDACGFARQCRTERQACEPFAGFVATGAFDRNAARRPTRSTFRSIFHPPRSP
jgi:hypothetical protein